MIFFLEKFNCSIWRPEGLLSTKILLEAISEFSKFENKGVQPNRFSDFTFADASHITFNEIKQIHLVRSGKYEKYASKSVFYVINDLQFGIVRMYQSLMSETPIQMEVFRTKEECSNFLQIPEEVLFNPTTTKNEKTN